MSSAKIRVKIGALELDYEGDASFLGNDLDTLLKSMVELSNALPTDELVKVQPAPSENGNSTKHSDTFNFTTNTIAAHIDVKNGPELVVCAMAQLELVQGKSSSNRAEIFAQMKAATSYYNENMGKNLTAAISSLTKSKRINQLATDTYALSAAEKKKLEAKVVEIG